MPWPLRLVGLPGRATAIQSWVARTSRSAEIAVMPGSLRVSRPELVLLVKSRHEVGAAGPYRLTAIARLGNSMRSLVVYPEMSHCFARRLCVLHPLPFVRWYALCSGVIAPRSAPDGFKLPETPALSLPCASRWAVPSSRHLRLQWAVKCLVKRRWGFGPPPSVCFMRVSHGRRNRGINDR